MDELHIDANLCTKINQQGNMTRSPVSSNQEGSDLKTIGVADEHIGAVVGRGGRTITEISQVGSVVKT
jgi:hypothetical protein